MSITLSADAVVGADALRIIYELANDTGETIHMLNIVQKWTPAGLSTDPSNLYTEVVDSTLRLTKANLPVPEHIDVESPDVPLLTAVEGGAVATEELVLDLPLAPYHPYDEVELTDAVVTYENVELAIGWLPAHVEVRVGTRPDGTRVTSTDHQIALREQQLLVAPLPVAVPTHLVPRATPT